MMATSLRITSLITALTLTSCCFNKDSFEPHLAFTPSPCLLESRPSAFEGLTPDEAQTPWGREMRAAYAFTAEQDYYRAITCFKRALLFLPPHHIERHRQIEYAIFYSYYLANKFCSAIEAFEASALSICDKEFAPYRDLLIALYECYIKESYPERARAVMERLEEEFPTDSAKLAIARAFGSGDVDTIASAAAYTPEAAEIGEFLGQYCAAAKSPSKAQVYQAILPGAGYYYVGQKKAAVTSFLINGLFLWASYRFFESGYPAAGLITASLESGWYLGGINGARLAALEYNQALYEVNGREFMRQRQFFPILMIQSNF